MSTRSRFSRRTLLQIWSIPLLVALATPLASEAHAQAATNPRLKVGWVTGTPATALLVGKEKGFFAAEKIEVELIPFAGGPQNVAALAAREIHIGTAAPVPFLHYLSRRQDIIGIASLFGSGSVRFLSGGYIKSDEVLPSGFFIVREESPIRSVKDLRGKTVAAGNALGTVPEMYTRTILKQNGLQPSDMNYTTLGFELMPGAVGAGTVDGAFVWEPFYSIARTKYKVRVIYTDIEVERLLAPKGAEPWGAGGILVLTRREFAEQNKAVIIAFLRGYKRSLNWIWQNLEEAKLITAKYANFGPEIVDKVVINPGPRDGKFPVVSLERSHNMMVEMGALKAPVAGWPEKHIDYSYLDAAKID